MKRPKVLLVFSDAHAGSSVGLCCPDGPTTDDGQVVHPSKAQLWLWDCFERLIARAREVKKQHKAELIAVCNGDAVEGLHHGSTQIMAPGKDAQAYIAKRIFDPVATLQPEKVFLVRGTEVHVGASGSDEESLAASLRHTLPIQRDRDTGLWSHWQLVLDIHGCRVDFQHHANVGGLPWTAPGAIARLAFRIWTEHAERSLPAPHLAIRSHRHQFRDSYDHHKVRAIITPAFQLKTGHAHKVVPESIADVGGLIVVIQPDGRYTVEPVLFAPERPKAWRIA